MSKMPNVGTKPKYNHDDKFRWVDSQWEKFMTEQQELKADNAQLQKDLETCTKHYSKLWDEHKKLKEKLYNENRLSDIINREDNDE